VGTGVETSVVDRYDACRRVAGSEIEAEFARARAGEVQRRVVDPGLAARELGWQPQWTIEDGLRATWESIVDG